MTARIVRAAHVAVGVNFLSKPTTFTWGKFFILVGDGGSPEQFTAPCGLISRSFDQTANTLDTNVPDCDDPDAPAYIERAVDTLSAQITGTGVLAQEALDDVWQPWFESIATRTVRIGVGVVPDIATGRYWEGPFILSQFNISAPTKGQKVQCEITMVNDGQWTFVEAVT